MIQTTAPVLFPPFLLATDGSPSARLAQTLLTTIAQALQAQHNGNGQALVTVLTVKPRRSSRSRRLRVKPSPDGIHLPEATQALTTLPADSLVDATLDAAAIAPLPGTDDDAASIQKSFPAGLSIAVQVRQGRPAIEILNCARTLQAGLIAVGSGDGPIGVRGRLLGSVSAVIARYAPSSVLVARGAIAQAEPSLHHILLVVNDSPATQAAIESTRQLLPAGIRQITILYAQSPLNADYLFGPFTTPTPSWQLNQSLQDAQKEQSEQILQHAKAAFNQPDIEISTLRQTGDAGPLICQIAQQRQIDLIVLGGHTMRRWLRLPVGDALFPLQSFRRSQPASSEKGKPSPVLRNTRLSATEDYTLHHAPCPVLLCRSAQPVSH